MLRAKLFGSRVFYKPVSLLRSYERKGRDVTREMNLIRRRRTAGRCDKHYDEMDNRAQTPRSDVPLNKSTWKRLVARKEVRDFVTRPELFSLLMWLPSLVVSRLSFLPFVSRPADILAGRFPTRAARLLRISSRQPSPRRSIDPRRARTAEMQGPFLRVRGERPRVPVSAIRSKNSRGRDAARREPSRRKEAASWISRINPHVCIMRSMRLLFCELLRYPESLFAKL